jgi:hypothetical protein
MNKIISSYLTSSIDRQRGEKKSADDIAYIQDWYNSIVSKCLSPIVLHDNLSDEFVSNFPFAKFIKVEPIPEGMNLYDYRWVIYFEYLLNNELDFVFFTDISDVIMRNNPFPEMKKGVLYCGDEQEKICESEWMRTALNEPLFFQLGGFKEMIYSDRPLLNCGLLGGSYDSIIGFLDTFVSVIELVRLRNTPEDKTNDMSLFNYTAQFFRFQHGRPVNSIFKKYEKCDDVWFIHK